MKDWADIEAEREVEEMLRSWSAPAPVEPGAQLTNAVGAMVVIAYGARKQGNAPAWRMEAAAIAMSLGADGIRWSNEVRAFVRSDSGQIVFTEVDWLHSQRFCIVAMERIAAEKEEPR